MGMAKMVAALVRKPVKKTMQKTVALMLALAPLITHTWAAVLRLLPHTASSFVRCHLHRKKLQQMTRMAAALVRRAAKINK